MTSQQRSIIRIQFKGLKDYIEQLDRVKYAMQVLQKEINELNELPLSLISSSSSPEEEEN